MNTFEDVLRYDELAGARLRTLYGQFGYTQYRMRRFEEYEMYADNKAFLASGDIITFTGPGGRLMALRPDVTLSIVKGVRDDGGLKKLYYCENIYRPDTASREFKERMQAGLECIGDIDIYSMAEVIMLAHKSLSELSDRTSLDISHMGFIAGLLEDASMSDTQRSEILRRISEKNVPELRRLCPELGLGANFTKKITALAALYGPYGQMLKELREISLNDKTHAALSELEQVYEILRSLGADRNLFLDFSIVNDLSYYSGIIFQGFIEGIPTQVLSGGRYDSLLGKFGKKSGALGFAVYLDLLERITPQRGATEYDVLLVYDDTSDMQELARTVKAIAENGSSICVRRGNTDGIKHKKLMHLMKGNGKND